MRDHWPPRGAKSNSGDQRYFQKQAEDLTGITHQQVSKWRRRLKEPEKYRVMRFGAAYATAMADEDLSREPRC